MPSAGSLKVRTERRGPVYVLAVSGDLGTGSSAGFTEAVERAAISTATSSARVVVDLSGVRSIDAAGVQALATAIRPAAGRCRVVLRSLRPPLRQVVMAVSPELDLARSGLVMAPFDAAGGIDTTSPTWTLEQESRRARFRAEQTITDTRHAAEKIAATEEKLAATLLCLTPRRPGAHERLLALSQLATRHAARMRGLTENAAAARASGIAPAGRHNTVQRAIAFINDHARDDIAAADIAAAACVTTRAVQLAFRRSLGITPLGYLRQVRLEQAHRELLAAPPVPGTVTRIAADWRFTNLSRFTARYRAAYGVLPSQTLHHREQVPAERLNCGLVRRTA